MNRLAPDTPEPESIRQQRRLLAMSLQRTRLSAERCYQNAEQTLSSWIRSALSLMVIGMIIDRFGLFLHHLFTNAHSVPIEADALSGIVALALVGAGELIAVISSVRFHAYARVYSRDYRIPANPQPSLTRFFALMVACFGLCLFSIMLFIIVL